MGAVLEGGAEGGRRVSLKRARFKAGSGPLFVPLTVGCVFTGSGPATVVSF